MSLYSKESRKAYMFPQSAPSPNTNRLLDHIISSEAVSKPIELTKRPDVALLECSKAWHLGLSRSPEEDSLGSCLLLK